MQQGNQSQFAGRAAIDASVDERALFITRTYTHLFGAILLFMLIEVVLFESGMAESIATALLSVNWLFVLGGFMVVGWLASRTAHRSMSQGAMYGALGLFVFAEAIIFVPLLYIAQMYADGGVIQSAALVTLFAFTGLTAIVFVTRKDFSFLRTALMYGGVIAIVAIVAAVLFGTQLGTWFSVAMIGFAGAAILYDTSKIIHHYPTDRYVGAALELFASVALMFWYVLRLFLSRD